MTGNSRGVIPSRSLSHFNGGPKCLNRKEKEVVNVRTSGSIGGPVGKLVGTRAMSFHFRYLFIVYLFSYR